MFYSQFVCSLGGFRVQTDITCQPLCLRAWGRYKLGVEHLLPIQIFCPGFGVQHGVLDTKGRHVKENEQGRQNFKSRPFLSHVSPPVSKTPSRTEHFFFPKKTMKTTLKA